MPKDDEINDLRVFIKNYYKKEIYLKIFDTAVIKNKIFLKNHQKYFRENSYISKQLKNFKSIEMEK
jgi:hypothetical protein